MAKEVRLSRRRKAGREKEKEGREREEKEEKEKEEKEKAGKEESEKERKEEREKAKKERRRGTRRKRGKKGESRNVEKWFPLWRNNSRLSTSSKLRNYSRSVNVGEMWKHVSLLLHEYLR